MSNKIKKLSGPFAKLRACDCFPEAKNRLLAGVPPTKVAKFIQDNGEYTHIHWRSLAAQLCAYRRTLHPAELVKIREPDFVADAKEKIQQALDEEAEIAELFQVQKERIKQGRSLEEKLGVLNKTLGNEVRIAAELLRTSAAIKEQTGLADPVADRGIAPAHMYDVRSRYGERVAKVIEDPSKRSRVLSAVGALLSAADNKAKEQELAEQEAKAGVG